MSLEDIILDNCDITIETTEILLKKVLTGLRSPIAAIASGEIQVEGGSTSFLQFLANTRSLWIWYRMRSILAKV